MNSLFYPISWPVAQRIWTAVSVVLFITWGLFAATPLPTLAAERVALVIGIDDYPSHPLKNAVKDAAAVRDLLRGDLGFPESSIVYTENPDRITFYEKFETLKKLSAGAEVVLVYYAGHGMESLDGKENFLLPRDADAARAAESEAALRATGINLLTLSTDLAGASQGAKVFLMDCCRQRPAGRGGDPRAGGGMAAYTDERIPADTLMMLAASPSRAASDGSRGHGPFTQALLEVLPNSSDNLMETFFAVSDRVQETTARRQIPWMKFDGSGRIFRERSFFATGASPGAAAGLGPQMSPIPPVPAVPPGSEENAAARKLRAATVSRPFVNSLGMSFVPLPGNEGVYICQTETRVRDFRAYAQATGFTQSGGAYVAKVEEVVGRGYMTTWRMDSTATWERPGFDQSEDHPVVCVTWDEANTFCHWLTGQEPGLSYRLPLDEEWTSAAGTSHRYPWGNEWPPPKGVGNYAGLEKRTSLPGNGWTIAYGHSDGNWTTARVASYQKNPHGLWDLGGNVWEYCIDRYRESMNEAMVLESFPHLKMDPAEGDRIYRIRRGGSWYDYPETYLRTSLRDKVSPQSRGSNTGFRVVVEAAPGG